MGGLIMLLVVAAGTILAGFAFHLFGNALKLATGIDFNSRHEGLIMSMSLVAGISIAVGSVLYLKDRGIDLGSPDEGCSISIRGDDACS